MFKNTFTSKPRKVDREYSKLIFNLYYGSAYKAAYFYCGDKDIAEEAAQEAIFKAIQNVHQLKDPEKIEPWIKKITINNVNAIFKKREKIVSLDKLLSVPDSLENTPDYVIDSQENIAAIAQAIESLEPLIKQVFHLRYCEEMKIKDISILLNKPEGTIKSWLHRGKIIIKKQLLSEGYTDISDADFRGGNAFNE